MLEIVRCYFLSMLNLLGEVTNHHSTEHLPRVSHPHHQDTPETL